MTLFMGGPYDGQDLPVGTATDRFRLPDVEQLEEFVCDPLGSVAQGWPHIYFLDRSGDVPVYRFLAEEVEGPDRGGDG